MTSQSNNNLNIIYGYPETRMIAGRPYAFVTGVHFVGDHGRAALFQVDLDRALVSNVSDGFPTTNGYIVGADGALLAETDYDAPSKRWSLKHWAGHWTEVGQQQTSIEVPALLGLGRTDGTVLIGYQGESNYTVHEAPLDGGKWGDALADADPERLLFDPVSHRLMGSAVLVGDTERYTFYAPGDQKIWNALAAAYPGSRVTFASMSDDHQKWVLFVDSPTEGPAYALVDLATKKGSWIGDVYNGLKPGDVSPVKPIAFAAKDGLRSPVTSPRPTADLKRAPPGRASARRSRHARLRRVRMVGPGLGVPGLRRAPGQLSRVRRPGLGSAVRRLRSVGA